VNALTPPLKWAGGKRWLLPHLLPLWQPGHRLVEPFCGGLAVALGLNPAQAWLNDINPHVVNFYCWLKTGLRIDLDMCNDEAMYYAHRTEFNRLIQCGLSSSRAAAELFYYLNRTGYNGLCRFNKSGAFNVPFGKYKTINYLLDFSAYQQKLSPWQFISVDFSQLTLAPNDFIYADPPYDVEFTQYAQHGFAWQDQERLAVWLTRHSGSVVVSNQATPRILELYRDHGFEIRLLDAPRRISCTGDRTPAQEMLATRHGGVPANGGVPAKLRRLKGRR